MIVDVRIPVLDRMHAKRLPAYQSLGFDTPRGRRRPRRGAGKLSAVPDEPPVDPF